MPYVCPSLASGQLSLEDVKTRTDVNASTIVASNGTISEVIRPFHLVKAGFRISKLTVFFRQRFYLVTYSCEVWLRLVAVQVLP